MKTCSKCKTEKGWPAFSQDRSRKDGLQSQCRACRAEQQQERLQIPAGRETSKKASAKNYSTIRGHLQCVFGNMKRRCTNPKVHNYKYYGGREIKVCFASSNEFIDYVINELQVDPRSLTIDRIDNDGNYERGNIRFVTQAVNNRNNRNKK